MQNTLSLTADGSHTLLSAQFGVTYHSVHGSVQEAQTVFLDAAFAEITARPQTEIRVLEIGFGTGLNALMTFGESLKTNKTLHYTAIEAFPISDETAANLNYATCLDFAQAADFLHLIHQNNWDTTIKINENIDFTKLLMRFEDIAFENEFDAIYFDAFAPNAQPELWTIAIFEKMYRALKPNGILTTYCAKGEVKRNLKAAGFKLESLPGPVGKREMTRAIRE
jgi:tRNA U34 5-methylaminomethyl-2-thiouridine-forming methyltransferase MnmC